MDEPRSDMTRYEKEQTVEEKRHANQHSNQGWYRYLNTQSHRVAMFKQRFAVLERC